MWPGTRELFSLQFGTHAFETKVLSVWSTVGVIPIAIVRTWAGDPEHATNYFPATRFPQK